MANVIGQIKQALRADPAEQAVRGICVAALVCFGIVWVAPLPTAAPPTAQVPEAAAPAKTNQNASGTITIAVAPPPQVDRPIYIWSSAAQGTGQPALPKSLPVVAGSSILIVADTNQAPRMKLGNRPFGAKVLQTQSGSYISMAVMNKSASFVLDAPGQSLATDFQVEDDAPPTARFTDPALITPQGTLRFSIKAQDDLGIATAKIILSGTGGKAQFTHSHTIIVPDQTTKLTDIAYVDMRDHRAAGSAVSAQLMVTDTGGHVTTSQPVVIYTPARRLRSFDAALVYAQAAALLRNADYTHEVAVLLRRIADQLKNGPDDGRLDAGVVLGFAVAYHRLTGQSLNEPMPPWPLMPASPEDVEAVAPLLRSLAVRIDARKLYEASENLGRTTAALEQALTPAVTPRQRQAALWQWRGAVRAQLIALFLDAIRYDNVFLFDMNAGQDGNPQGKVPHAISRQLRQLSADLLDDDWAAARGRIDAVEDALGFAIAGPITGSLSGAKSGQLATLHNLAALGKAARKLAADDTARTAASVQDDLNDLLARASTSSLKHVAAPQRKALRDDIEALINAAGDYAYDPVRFKKLDHRLNAIQTKAERLAQKSLSDHLRLKPALVSPRPQPVISRADYDLLNGLLAKVPPALAGRPVAPFYRALDLMQIIDVTAETQP